jgi:hypothetical protein
MDRQLGGVEIEADDPAANAGALPLAIFMTGRNEGELAPERSQGRGRLTADGRLALVANAFFVDEQQVTRRTEAEFDLVVSDGLDHLDLDAIPRAGAATDDIGRTDLECVAIDMADVGVMRLPGPAIARLPAALEAAVEPQQLDPWSRP